MKRAFIVNLFALIMLLMLPNVVDAASLKVTVSCSDVTLNSTTTCVVKGTASGGEISSFRASYSVNGATFSKFANGSGWQGEAYNNSISLYTGDNKKGSFTIGTFTLKGTKAGTATITLSGIYASDGDFNDINGIANATGKFTVKTATTKSTATTKKTTSSTTKSTTTSRTSRTTSTSTTTERSTSTSTTINTSFTSSTRPTTSTTSRVEAASPEARLTSLSVGDFEVKYERGIYTVIVYPETESVEIKATGPEGSTVTGIGTRNLAVGNNAVSITLRMPTNETVVFPLFIVRPDPNKQVDTRLKSLKVVGYDIGFNADKKEYSVTLPLGCNEIHIDYEAMDNDVIVTGAGTILLSKDSNALYVKVSYGALSTTDYVIKIKRNYTTIVLIVVIVLLIAGIGGMLYYYYDEKKKANEDANSIKNKLVADANRAELAKGPQASFNGQSVVGTGRRTVLPTAQVQAADNSAVPTNNQPVAAAQNVAPAVAPNAPLQPEQNVANAPSKPLVTSTQISSVTPPTGPQVKVIKKIIKPNDQTAQTPANAVSAPGVAGINITELK